VSLLDVWDPSALSATQGALLIQTITCYHRVKQNEKETYKCINPICAHQNQLRPQNISGMACRVFAVSNSGEI